MSHPSRVVLLSPSGPSAATSTSCLIQPSSPLHPHPAIRHPSIHPPPILRIPVALLCPICFASLQPCALPVHAIAALGSVRGSKRIHTSLAILLRTSRRVLDHHHLRLGPPDYLAPPPTSEKSQTPRRPLSLARSRGDTCTPLQRAALIQGVPYYILAQSILQ